MSACSARQLEARVRSTALTCAIINQLATPGLGSIIGRRFLAGLGQLLLAAGGFVMIVGWMVRFFFDRYREASDQAPVGGPYGWWGRWGLILFGAGWLWALFTSVSLLGEAKKAAISGQEQVPPRISPSDGKA